VPQMTSKPLTWFKPDPNQPRRQFDESELRQLGRSLRQKQFQPVLARPDGTLIAGERRYRAAKLEGLESLLVIVTDEPLTDSQVRQIQLTENMHRSDLTGHEKWQACVELMEMNPGWQHKDLAEHLHLDASMVPRLLSPSKCIPAAQEALATGKIGISDCYALAKLDPSEQPSLLAMKLAGASRDQIEQAGRKARGAGTEVVRVQRVKCILPSGVAVVVSGEGVSLDEGIEALGEAIKEMKRARDLGYTAKTFAAAMRDKAKQSGR
jgi:ParB family chromosome partitioning protein